MISDTEPLNVYHLNPICFAVAVRNVTLNTFKGFNVDFDNTFWHGQKIHEI